MKKILFLCQESFGLHQIFEAGLSEFSGCEVTSLTYQSGAYDHAWQRVANFLYRLFGGVSLKVYWSGEKMFSVLDKKLMFDHILVISPEKVHPIHLRRLKARGYRMVAYYWDGFDHFKSYQRTLKYFDACFSFDPVDVSKYGLRSITNFYYCEDFVDLIEYDIFFLGSYDDRYTLLKKIVLSAKESGLSYKILIFDKKSFFSQNMDGPVQIIQDPIPASVAIQMLKKTRIVLDVHKEVQTGLSFRVFEAMGLRKKLVTTNSAIVNYDFYHPNNIFVWGEGCIEIPESFLALPYVDLPASIYEKYSQKSWVKKVLDI